MLRDGLCAGFRRGDRQRGFHTQAPSQGQFHQMYTIADSTRVAKAKLTVVDITKELATCYTAVHS